ncbi:MAG: PKD domain-containing protein [Thermoplasmata archaeon]|nr:MAG: PKD domain-containing protein [Thermoplasmata archaeon]
MTPIPRGTVPIIAMAVLALAALVLFLTPASAESIDIYEFEEISTTYGANAVAVRADGGEGLVLTSERNQSTGLYTNIVFTTTGTSLSQRQTFVNQSWYWRAAAYDPVSNHALMGGSRGTLYKWDGSSITRVTTSFSYDIHRIVWHPEDEVAYLGTTTSRIYQYRSGTVSYLVGTYSSVQDLAIRPDGGELAIAAYNMAQLYNLSRNDMNTLPRPLNDDSREYYYIYSIEYSLDGNSVLANWYDWNEYAMFRYVNDKWIKVARASGRINFMDFEAEGTFILLGQTNNLQYLQGGSIAPVPDWYTTGSSGVNDFDYNSQGFYFIVGTPEGVFKLKRKPNVKPWLDRDIPDFEFNEDEKDGGDNLIDLSAYIRDDRAFDKLRFEFDLEQDPTLIDGEVDGMFLDFTQMVEHWNGRMTFRIKVWDGGSDDRVGTADDQFNRTNMFNVTIRQVNDPVLILSLGSKTVGNDDLVWFVAEGNWLNLSIVTEDVDNYEYEIQPPRFAFNRSLPTLKVDADEMMLTFQPRNKDVGSIYVNLSVTDGYGSYAYADIVFHVSNVNNPPRLMGIRDRTVNEDRWLNFTVSAKDDDMDIGIETYLTFSTNRTDGVGDDDLPNLSFLVDDEDTTRIKVSFLPTNEDVGVIWVEFRVSDGFGTVGEWQDIKSMTITVVNTNDAPNLIEVDGVSTSGMTEFPLTATEDQELSVTFLAQDDDLDPLFFYVDDSRFTLSQPGAGYGATVTFTPTNDDVGNLMVTISVWDVFNTFDELLLNISVRNVNDAPILLTFESQDVTDMDQVEYVLFEDVLFTAPIKAYDMDSETLTYSDSGGVFTFAVAADTRSAFANFTPTQADVGEITTILEVDDGDGEIDVIVIILTVMGTNDPPGTPEISQLAFDSLTIPLRATLVTDPDGDELNYTWDFGDNSPKESGIGLTDVTHDYPRPGNFGLVLTVDDGNGGVTTTHYDVLVPDTGETPPETKVEEGPVLFVVVMIVVFGALAGVFLYLYWKLPKDNGGAQ